ncbi:MAG: class I SAM-dependent methyltransferase [Chthoniobacterales bacterium]
MLSKLQSVLNRARAEGSWSGAAKRAWHNPEKVWAYLRRTGSRAWVDALFANAAEYEGFVGELEASKLLMQLQARLRDRFSTVEGMTTRGNRYMPGAMLTPQAATLYALIRARRPAKIVETGVCNGFSSAVILSALARNGAGYLYSIDFPEFATAAVSDQGFWEGKGGAVVPENERSGWLVPSDLRDRWLLRLGRSKEELPPLLDELCEIDLFVHDSEHSYENQLFEFRSAFAHLGAEGVLFASDINWSSAFEDFAKQVASASRFYYVDYSLGVLLRN